MRISKFEMFMLRALSVSVVRKGYVPESISPEEVPEARSVDGIEVASRVINGSGN